MKKNLIAAIVLLTLCIPFWSCQSTRSSTSSRLLRFNFENGKGYDYEMIMNMDNTANGKTTQSDFDNYYSMDVTKEENGIRTIRTRYDRFKLTIEAGPATIDVDTDHPLPADTGKIMNVLSRINKIISGIKGRDFYIKADADGKVIEVTGIKEIFEAMMDSMGITGPMKEEARKSFSNQFGEKKIASQFERFFSIMPGKNVKTGDSWERIYTDAGPGGMNYHSTYTVDEIEGDMVTLKEKTDVQVDGKVTGKMTGTLVIDSRSGLIVKADQELKSKSDNGNATHIMIQIRGKAR